MSDVEHESASATITGETITTTALTDRFVVRAVVIGLTLIGLVGISGSIGLSAFDKNVPGELWTLIGTAVGSLGTLLARTSSS